MNTFNFSVDDIQESGQLVFSSLEEFKSKDEEISKVVAAARHLTKEEFMKAVIPGDVVVSYPRRSSMHGAKVLSIKVTQWAQKSSFSSSKIIGKEGKEIVGYDTRVGDCVLNSNPIKHFLDMHEVVMLLRHRSITPEKRQKIIDFIYSKKEEETPYAYGKVAKSFLKHLFANMDKKVKDGTITEKDEKKLFCSSIIKLAYKHAGCDISCTGVSSEYVWPKDLLLSSSMIKVGGYFSPEAKVETPSSAS